MYDVTRILEWDSGHRVLGHEGKCKYIHGHRYKAEITVTKSLDALSRVVDFSVIKRVIGAWIDEYWDHNFLCHKDDPILGLHLMPDAGKLMFAGQAPYVMKSGNPTAETIAEELYGQCVRLLGGAGLIILNVRVWETPNCYADFHR